jgi:hypothetical protein
MKKLILLSLIPLAVIAHAEQVPEPLYRQILADQYPDDIPAYEMPLTIDRFTYRLEDVNCDGAPDYVLDEAPGFCGVSGSGVCSPLYYRKDGSTFTEIRNNQGQCRQGIK